MPKHTTVDTRGLSCPQPALQTHQTIHGLAGGTVEVLVDSGTARDNVTRVAERAGWRVGEEAQADGSLKLILRK
jgi:tRNA 2-thiouridine synthesizing protein A